MTLFGVAVLFIEQEADFLAAVQIIVYAGAIVVLFLFVIMFLGVDKKESIEIEPLAGQRPLAFIMLGVTLAGVIATMAESHWVTGAHQVVGPIQGNITADPSSPSGEVAQLGKQLFTTYLFAFEATAALLVIAVVGAVVLARRPPVPTDAAGERAESELTA
jgi:NADH-quinone oxidoreductase subunit J